MSTVHWVVVQRPSGDLHEMCGSLAQAKRRTQFYRDQGLVCSVERVTTVITTEVVEAAS